MVHIDNDTSIKGNVSANATIYTHSANSQREKSEKRMYRKKCAHAHTHTHTQHIHISKEYNRRSALPHNQFKHKKSTMQKMAAQNMSYLNWIFDMLPLKKKRQQHWFTINNEWWGLEWLVVLLFASVRFNAYHTHTHTFAYAHISNQLATFSKWFSKNEITWHKLLNNNNRHTHKEWGVGGRERHGDKKHILLR